MHSLNIENYGTKEEVIDKLSYYKPLDSKEELLRNVLATTIFMSQGNSLTVDESVHQLFEKIMEEKI